MNVSYYLKIEKQKNDFNAANLGDNGSEGQTDGTEAAADSRAIKPAKCGIYARICYKGYKTKYFISQKINPALWDKTTQRAKKVKKFPEHPEFNGRLDNIESTISKIALRYANEHEGKYPTPDILKRLLDETGIRDGKKKEAWTFLSFFEEFINKSKDGGRLTDNGKPITPGTIRSYTTTKGIIELYQKHTGTRLDFETMDMIFYTNFKKYLMHTKQQSTNYISKHIKVIKTVLGYAEDNYRLTVNPAYKSKAFVATTEKTDSVYLTEAELKEIAGRDLRNNLPLDRVRDLFLIGCHTGLRFSDLSTLTPDNINGGMIAITQIKTGDKVVIPVHPSVSEIMQKYDGNLPAALTNQKMNDALKLITKECKMLKKKVGITFTKGGVTVSKGGVKPTETPEKWQLVTTHTARRSFCTNQYLNGIPAITIMAISGHKTETAFMKYIKVAAQEHANIIKTSWDKRQSEQPKTMAI